MVARAGGIVAEVGIWREFDSFPNCGVSMKDGHLIVLSDEGEPVKLYEPGRWRWARIRPALSGDESPPASSTLGPSTSASKTGSSHTPNGE